MGTLTVNQLATATVGANEESVGDFLQRRERELIQQTAALRGALVPKEAELAKVRQAMEALGIAPNGGILGSLTLAAGMLSNASSPDHLPGGFHPQGNTPLPLLAGSMTIKEMIMNALTDHFQNGATPSELRDYMRNAYGREIDRNSIGPQLARLREEGAVEAAKFNEGKPDEGATVGKWRLKEKVERRF